MNVHNGCAHNGHTSPCDNPPPATMYVVWHNGCGHIAAGYNRRTLAEDLVVVLGLRGYRQWRVRVASDADLDALARGVRCAACVVDVGVVP